ncbi:MAG TPA: hypothetical protein VER03_21670, partial [Bryobacteraceae bacterium]|nr:hypothetical protein [Bryobacteraceae bacterium]
LAMYSDVSIADRRRAACEDNALPSLDLYYGTASKLVDRAFTPTMRKEGRLLMFLKERLARMKTPVDVGPALRMVLTAKLDPPEREDLVAAFTGMLSRIAESHREFLWTETMLGLDTETLRRTPALIPALRSYVVRQLSGTRCAERFDEEPRSVQRLNAAIINIDPQGLTYRPISPKESKPDRKGAAFDSEDAWQSNRSEQVLEALRWLKHGNRDLPDNQRFWTAAERSTDEWNARYQALVKILEGWKEEEERFPELYVFMVCQTYSSLAALLPPGRAQDNHVDAYLSFLEGRYSPVENRNLWFTQVKHLLGNKVFLPRFARSRNPVIATYAKLQMRLAR